MPAAVEEVEDWAWEHGFVRTHEHNLRLVLVDGKLRYRGICYRISKEEEAATNLSQQEMIERAERLRGLWMSHDHEDGLFAIASQHVPVSLLSEKAPAY